MQRFTITLFAFLLVGCEPESPTALDSPPTGFEAIREIMNSPVDETTIARLNAALGRPTDAPLVHVTKNGFVGETVVFTNPNTGESLRGVVARSGSGSQDVVCSFTNGGQREDFEEFLNCADRHPECDIGFETDVHVDTGAGTVTVVITEVQVICEGNPIG